MMCLQMLNKKGDKGDVDDDDEVYALSPKDQVYEKINKEYERVMTQPQNVSIILYVHYFTPYRVFLDPHFL